MIIDEQLEQLVKLAEEFGYKKAQQEIEQLKTELHELKLEKLKLDEATYFETMKMLEIEQSLIQKNDLLKSENARFREALKGLK